jgi:hypothetical protein
MKVRTARLAPPHPTAHRRVAPTPLVREDDNPRREGCMELKAGDRLHSAVSDVEVIVIRAPGEAVSVTCGGLPLARAGEDGPRGGVVAGQEGEVLLGKRYVDEGDTLELLCTKPGVGALAVDGHPLQLKTAKPLPSSD